MSDKKKNLAIVIQVHDGEAMPFLVMVDDSCDERDILNACASRGVLAWKIKDGQKIDGFVVRIEQGEPPRGSGCGMPSHHHTCDCEGMGGDR
jgi:hypothetical protein